MPVGQHSEASDWETAPVGLGCPVWTPPLTDDVQAVTLMRINSHFSAVSCCPGNSLNAGTFSRAALLILRRITEVLKKKKVGLCDGRAPVLVVPAEGRGHGLQRMPWTSLRPSMEMGSVVVPGNPGAEAGEETSKLKSSWVRRR